METTSRRYHASSSDGKSVDGFRRGNDMGRLRIALAVFLSISVLACFFLLFVGSRTLHVGMSAEALVRVWGPPDHVVRALTTLPSIPQPQPIASWIPPIPGTNSEAWRLQQMEREVTRLRNELEATRREWSLSQRASTVRETWFYYERGCRVVLQGPSYAALAVHSWVCQ